MDAASPTDTPMPSGESAAADCAESAECLRRSTDHDIETLGTARFGLLVRHDDGECESAHDSGAE